MSYRKISDICVVKRSTKMTRDSERLSHDDDDYLNCLTLKLRTSINSIPSLLRATRIEGVKLSLDSWPTMLHKAGYLTPPHQYFTELFLHQLTNDDDDEPTEEVSIVDSFSLLTIPHSYFD